MPIKDSLATYIKGFFDSNFIYTDPFDAVVHSHVFEHIYYPAEFMSCLKAFIPEGKFLFFSLPNMKVYLQRKYTNCLNFEHTIFITEPYIEYLLAKNGFKILKKYFFKEDHSIFYAAIRDTYIRQQPFPAGLYEQNKMIFLDYVHYYQNLIAEFNKRLAHITNTVYVFGAHIFTQFLICNGLDVSKIQGILDNDTNKQGKRLSGTSLTVYPPQVLKGLQKPVVILKVATYADEIKEDIINNMNNTVIFWE